MVQRSCCIKQYITEGKQRLKDGFNTRPVDNPSNISNPTTVSEHFITNSRSARWPHPSLLIDGQPPFVDPVMFQNISVPLQMQHYGQGGLAGEKRKPPWLGKFPVTDFYVG